MSNSTQAVAAINPSAIRMIDGQPTTTSLIVAETFGKLHKDILKHPRNLPTQLDEEHGRNFAPMLTKVKIGQGAVREEQAYRITKYGFTLLAMGLTGDKALQFKIAYIDAFDQMEQQLRQPANDALPPPSDPELLTLDYDGRRLRILRLDGAPWLVAADLALALGLRNSYVILRRLQPQQHQKRMVGKQQVNILKMSAVRHTLLLAKPERAQPFQQWLDQALQLQQPAALPAPAAATIPASSISGEVRDFTLSYLHSCRQAIRDAGGTLPAWDTTTDQRISDAMAALLINDKRWLLTFDTGGEPKLKAIPSSATVLTPEHLVEWLADPHGARPELIPQILQAISQRMGARA